ncbi:MAG: LysR family transcriptional regulator [Pseudomonadota bacterium]
MDLNLLTVLHALLEHCSTQAAADSIGRTQSAVSHSLGRLRSLFNDPILERRGPRLIPTELALRMQQPLQSILHDVANLIVGGAQFDPKSSDRQIVIAARDLAFQPTMAIYRSLTADAPNLRFRIVDADDAADRLLGGQIDLLVSIYHNDLPKGLELHNVTNLGWSTFARKGHPISSDPSVEEWASYKYVQVYMGPDTKNPVEDAVAVGNTKRVAGLQVDSFIKALHMTSQTDLLFTTLGPLARPMAGTYGLREITPPVKVPLIPMGIGTRATKYDPMSKWLLTRSLAVLSRQFAPAHGRA